MAHALSLAFRLLLLLLGAVAFAVVWVVVRSHTGTGSTWMALLAALDAVLLTRLMGFPRGSRGAFAGGGFVLATIALTNYGTAAMASGAPLGFALQESLARMAPSLAWDIIRLANGPWDLVVYVIGAELAAWWCS